jgi:hypothetical protein
MIVTFIAYALLVFGIPNYVGTILGGAFMPIAWLFSMPVRFYAVECLRFFSGLISISCALLLFHFLGVEKTVYILIILESFIALYYYNYKRSILGGLGWASYSIGLICGWILSFYL